MLNGAPFLAIALIDNDPDFPGFAVSAAADGFAGRADVWVSRAAFASFITALDTLDQSLRGEARLQAGWVSDGANVQDDEIDADVTIRPKGHAGQLQVSVVLCEDRGESDRNIARLSFAVPEPNALTRFRLSLRDIVSTRSTETAVLTPGLLVGGV